MAAKRGALDLLNVYGNDSSDDEVPGFRVSTKRIYKDSDEELEANNKRRLPLPDIIRVEKDDISDDPRLHDGRIRSFPHERGNWATYVYVPYQMSDGMEDLLQVVNSYFSNLELKIVDHFHISLTKVVVLKHHWIEPFMQGIRQNISNLKCFMIVFDSLKVYCNEERTRTFIGLQIKSGYDSLVQLVHKMDKCLAEFNLPGFYKDPSLHMSVVWCVGDYEELIKQMLPELNEKVNELMGKCSQENWYIVADRLECKTGNKVFTFHIQ